MGVQVSPLWNRARARENLTRSFTVAALFDRRIRCQGDSHVDYGIFKRRFERAGHTGRAHYDAKKEQTKAMRKPIISYILGAVIGVIGMASAAQEKGGSTATVVGQVVCSSCWFEADRKVTPYGTEGDRKCAVACAKDGKSQAIAVAGKDGFTLYLLEPGRLRRERKDWLDFIAKRVKATGTVRQDGEKHYLKVDSIELASDATAR